MFVATNFIDCSNGIKRYITIPILVIVDLVDDSLLTKKHPLDRILSKFYHQRFLVLFGNFDQFDVSGEFRCRGRHLKLMAIPGLNADSIVKNQDSHYQD